MSDNNLKNSVYHEAGHAAAVLMLAPENVQVCCTLNDEKTDTEVYVERGPLPDPYTRAVIYLAGVFAEQIVLQGKNKREKRWPERSLRILALSDFTRL
jgi:hypothetical protein